MVKTHEQLWNEMDSLFQSVLTENHRFRTAIRGALNILRNGKKVEDAIEVLEQVNGSLEGWDV